MKQITIDKNAICEVRANVIVNGGIMLQGLVSVGGAPLDVMHGVQLRIESVTINSFDLDQYNELQERYCAALTDLANTKLQLVNAANEIRYLAGEVRRYARVCEAFEDKKEGSDNDR